MYAKSEWVARMQQALSNYYDSLDNHELRSYCVANALRLAAEGVEHWSPLFRATVIERADSIQADMNNRGCTCDGCVRVMNMIYRVKALIMQC